MSNFFIFTFFQMRTDERALEKKGGAIPRGLFCIFWKGKGEEEDGGAKEKESWRQEGKQESLWWPFFNGRGGEF